MSISSKLRYAMVGGGQGAFIGAVHRKAMALDGQIQIVAGALSSTPEKSRISGEMINLAPARNHSTWQALLEDELKRPADERIDFVSIVTPNHIHYPVAKAFVDEGFHVVCDKPLVHTSEQAQDLIQAVAKQQTIFGVTYNYTGYPMIRQAREMLRTGILGDIRKVVVEYNQGWLATHAKNNKQAAWRTDPSQTGIAGAMGDIGSHAENLITTVTGLEIEAICADLTSFVKDRILDDDASILLRFNKGARGVLIASQINIGFENDLRLRIAGSLGTLEWHQENPNYLIYFPADGHRQILTCGSPYLCEAAKLATRLPSGHPEGFIEAFANIYLGVAAAIRGDNNADYPDVIAGARGVRFIEKVVESSRVTEKWVNL